MIGIQGKKITLVLKRAPHALYHSIPNLCRLVYNMKVLSTRFTHNPRVTSILVKIQCDIFPQFFEHKGASSEMECSEAWMVDGLSNNFGRGSRNKLDDTGWDSSFREYFMNEVVGVSGSRGGFPDNDIAYKCRR